MLYLNDSGGNTWNITILGNGVFDPIPVSPQTPATVILNDFTSQTLTSWQMGINLLGELIYTSVTFDAGYPCIYALSPWVIRIQGATGEWETASALGWGVIAYTPVGGSLTGFTFVYPPRNVPRFSRNFVRHDNVASSGVRESLLERIEKFLSFDILVATGADLTNWSLFMDYAGLGGPFDFTPPASYNIPKTTYLLEDTNWETKYKSSGLFTFSVKFREDVGWP